ncbi:PH domain-containing protein [Mucilaginibacter sp. RS28]|uniref:PH domain-containing protein n=1 Tax=Mucilaginibacter straminoryzae TaxID=2932774 RepID=A0A9X1X4A1_9SPHI|nr:PH domain-containing protein [Mucilaginibacter straminoryzae]MCJ8210937.1 PH domain-containing protein [Mucilaginibacter straminoryzae]
MSPTQTFPSKITYWLFVPLFVCLTAALVQSIVDGAIAGTIILGGVLGLLLAPMFFNTRYTINGDVLNIRCGLIVNKDIDIHTIRKISKTDSIISSPTLSVNGRIDIAYNKYDNVIIAPQNLEKFIEALKSVEPGIVIEI